MLVVGAVFLLLLLLVSSEFHSSSSSNNLKDDDSVVEDLERVFVFGIHAFVSIVVNERIRRDLFTNGRGEIIFYSCSKLEAVC